jgi:hypothetical protein
MCENCVQNNIGKFMMCFGLVSIAGVIFGVIYAFWKMAAGPGGTGAWG